MSKAWLGSLLSIFCVSAVLADERIWTGAGNDSRWANIYNWQDDAAPNGDADTALFPAGTKDVLVDASTSIKTITFRNPGMTLTVASGHNLHFSNSGGPVLVAEEDATIGIGGTISFSGNPNGNADWADNRVANGKTLTIDAQITGDNGFEHNGVGGTIILTNPLNDQQGVTTTTGGGWLSVPTFSALGASSELRLGNGEFRYTGTPDSTALTFLHIGGTGSDRIVEHTGTGTLALNGAFRSANNDSHAFIFSVTETAGTIDLSGGYENGGTGNLWLYKRGPGKLRMMSATTHTGSTVIDGGTLEVVSPGSLSANSPVVMRGGKLLFTGGPAAIGAVQVNGNASTIEVPFGTTLTISSLSNVSGIIDFTATDLGNTTKILIPGYPEGTIGPWATVNGGTPFAAFAAYDDVQGIHAASIPYQPIDAIGHSIIPDNATEAARITTATGSGGGITLAANPTATALLSQEIATPAVVTFDGDGLVTPLVQITPSGASLTLGDAPGDGTLTAPDVPNSRLFLRNADAPGGAALTVNAALTDSATHGTSLDILGPGDIALAGPVTHSGGTWVSGGALTIANATDLAWPTGGIHGNGALVKSGGGILIMPNHGNSYAGTTTVTRGVIRVAHNDTFGSRDTPTVVEDGGAIDFYGADNQTLRIDGEEIFAQGNGGSDGQGALRNTSSRANMEALRLLTLTSNLTVHAIGRFDIRNAGGPASLKLNGHNLTKTGPEMFGLTSVAITGDQGTSSMDIQGGSLAMESQTTFSGDTNNIMRVRNGSILDYWNLAAPVPWTLIMDDGSRTSARGGYGTHINIWGGPVSLTGGEARFEANGFYSDTYPDTISGPGKLVKGGNENGTTFLLGTNNAWTGGTRIDDGILYAVGQGSIPNLAATTVHGRGTLALRVAGAAPDQPGFTLAEINALINTPGIFQSGSASIGFDTAYESLDYTDPFPTIGIRKFGPNTLTLTGTGADIGPVGVYGGTLDLSTRSRYLGDNNIVVSETAGANNGLSTLIIGGDAQITTADKGNNQSDQPRVTIGDAGRGVMHVTGNGKISGRIIAGASENSAGAIYQTGGTVHNTGGANNDGHIGGSGYGYYHLAGGTNENNGYSQLGYNTPGVGILHQTGGAYTFTAAYQGSLGLSRGGIGIAHLAGGTFDHAGSIWLGDSNERDSNNGYAELTVTSNANVTIHGAIDLGNRHNMSALLNLNGGQLTAARVYKAAGRNNSHAHVNWNGGLLRAINGDTELFNGGEPGLYPDITLHARGALIDIPDHSRNKNIAAPLRAPRGIGLLTIPIDHGGSGYIGAPAVRITDNGGGSAFAHIQDGEVTRIEITSPGNYTTVPTVTLIGGGATTPATLGAPLMGAVPSGGLTKLGAGTLTLSAANTYQGPTEIRDGTLALNHPAALTPYTPVTLTGGTLDLGGNTLSNGNLTATGGDIQNGRISAETLTKTGPGTLTLNAPLTVGPAQPPPLPPTPGLLEGMLPQSWNTWTPNPATGVQLNPRAAVGSQASNNNYAGGLWRGDYHTWVYTGYIWNRAPTNETWTFRARFDDNVQLRLDGGIWIDHGNNSTAIQNILITPGAHAIELRFGDGVGDVGPGDGEYYGISYDPLGRASDNKDDYRELRDTGDGQLLTTTLPVDHGPGLFESFIPSSWDTEGDGIPTGRQLTTRAGNGTVENNSTYANGLWRGNNHTWIYKGHIWNRTDAAVTWSWRLQFDDNVLLKINGHTVADITLGNGEVYVDHPLAPGANTIEIRFGDGGGDAGPNGGPGGLSYDPNGSGTYILLADDGRGTLLTTDIASGLPSAPAAELATVNVTGGTLRLGTSKSGGLYEGSVTGSFNTWEENPRTSIELTTTAANGAAPEDNPYVRGKFWPPNTTYVYTGFIWNRTGAPAIWTFAENFDDSVLLRIGDTEVLNNSSWDTPTIGTITLAPGSHYFEVRFGQGGGGAAANGLSDDTVNGNNLWWDRLDMSFGVDFQGRAQSNANNYVILEDSGNGELFTRTRQDPFAREELLGAAQINLTPGTVLDLDSDAHKVGIIAGDGGTVSNGTLTAGTVISPAGDDATGILALDGVTLAPGVIYHVTTIGAASDLLTSTGTLNLDGLTITPATDNVRTATTYVIATAAGGFTGTPTLSGFEGKKWKILRKSNELWLTTLGGTLLILK